MIPKIGQFYRPIPQQLPDEFAENLIQSGRFRIERIVSTGQSTPEGEWYDQAQYEWVILLQGSARLEFEGHADPVELTAGNFLTIPPHCRHRVAWTDPDQPTFWLAVHYDS